jgi:hypothetical protein
MSVIRDRDFEAKRPAWFSEPDFPADLKEELIEKGFAEPVNKMECREVHDDCMYCGEKLTTPYVYWNCAEGAISLHAKCAAKLAIGLAQDAQEVIGGTRGNGKSDGVFWLTGYAQKCEYGVEDEVS